MFSLESYIKNRLEPTFFASFVFMIMQENERVIFPILDSDKVHYPPCHIY